MTVPLFEPHREGIRMIRRGGLYIGMGVTTLVVYTLVLPMAVYYRLQEVRHG